MVARSLWEREVPGSNPGSPTILLMFYVYVLRSLKNGRFYIGYTNDLERRLNEHNNGESRYTRLTRPFELVYTEEFADRIFATRRERNLKSGQGREWLKEKFGRAVA